jgi:hypothetical protein
MVPWKARLALVGGTAEAAVPTRSVAVYSQTQERGRTRKLRSASSLHPVLYTQFSTPSLLPVARASASVCRQFRSRLCRPMRLFHRNCPLNP